MCPGTLPESWAAPGALSALLVLVMSNNNLSGPLPPSWGANSTSLGKLLRLDARQNALTGYLPDVWGPGFQARFEFEVRMHREYHVHIQFLSS